MNNQNELEKLVPIIVIKIRDKDIQVCDGKDLHKYLEVKIGFDNWIKDRINKYEFIEYEDFVFRNNTCYITLNMVRTLSMIEIMLE